MRLHPASYCLHAESDATLAQVVWGQLDFDLVTGEDANVVFAHFARNVSGHDVAVVELNTKHGVGQSIDHGAIHLDLFFFRHKGTCCLVQISRRAFCPNPARMTSVLGSQDYYPSGEGDPIAVEK